MVCLSFCWDDGSAEDMKMMDLSLKYKIPGIFFIPVTNQERGVITNEDIKLLSRNSFEIGAHTYSHSYLPSLPFEKADEELLNGKTYLEQLLGNEVPHFCFPGGKFNSELVAASKKYFKSARTADTGAVVKDNTFLIRPAFHFYNRGKKSIIYNSLKNASPVFRHSLLNILCSDYFDFIRNIITDLSTSPSIYKMIIWGHSWEVERYLLWAELEDFFKFINDSSLYRISDYSSLVISD
jgi:peptidoglycan/xylan/chitin deacetylase (PgdA/CDA1 family)